MMTPEEAGRVIDEALARLEAGGWCSTCELMLRRPGEPDYVLFRCRWNPPQFRPPEPVGVGSVEPPRAVE